MLSEDLADVPTCRPTDLPTCQPADLPTCRPADLPTWRPGDLPTRRPADLPSCRPADLPTDLPTCRPADVPTWRPTDLPTCQPADLPTCRPADVPTCHLKARPGSGQNVTRIKIAIGFSNHRGRRREGVPRMPSRRFLDASDALWWRWCRDAPVATRAQARNSCQSRVVQEPATSTPENDASI